MSLKFSPCDRLSLLRFARNCKQRSSLGTKISAQHSNPSQNKRSVFAKQNVSIKYFALFFTARLASAFSVALRSLLCKKRSLIKFSSADYLCFALLATASRGLAYAKFYLHNPKNHLTILCLDFLQSNLKLNLQILLGHYRLGSSHP